jgi:hypothetical protein
MLQSVKIVVNYQLAGQPISPNFKGQIVQEFFPHTCPEMSVSIKQFTVHNIPEGPSENPFVSNPVRNL